MRTILIFLCAFFFCVNTQAAQFNYSGTVTQIITNSSSYGANTDWFSISSFTNPTGFGNCKTPNIRIRDDLKGQRMYKALLAAELTGKSIVVYIDDSVTDANGWCYALLIVNAPS